jgi:hypothetical protein
MDPRIDQTQPGSAQGAWRRIWKNRIRQILHPGHKVFIVGPHRTATTTLHHFLSRQGLRSIHWRERDTFLAKEIDDRKGDDKALRRFLSRWTVFSDFMYLTDKEHIENHTWYRRYAQIFPEAYFILTDRDVDRWVNSRLRHRDGQWLARYLTVHGGTREQAIDTWRAEFLDHRAKALEFFRGHPRFLHFQIDKSDYPALIEPTDIAALIDLLAPDYELSPTMWASYNTERRSQP